MAGFLANHSIPNDWKLFVEISNIEIMLIELSPICKIFFNSAIRIEKAKAKVVFISPKGYALPYAFRLTKCCLNNVVEYQALIIGLKMAQEIKVTRIG